MKNWLKKESIWYRLQQLVILVAHLALLKWMLYTLAEAGTLTFSAVLLHFTGMACYGAILIRGSAYWAQYHYLKKGNKLIK